MKHLHCNCKFLGGLCLPPLSFAGTLNVVVLLGWLTVGVASQENVCKSVRHQTVL